MDDVPAVSFTATLNLDVLTTTNNSSNADSYLWDFGDGNTSTEFEPTHTYAQDGTYTVTLTASNDCGSVSQTQTVTVVTPPTAAFSASPTSGCAPLTVQFTDQSSDNVTSWSWQFPGGNPATSNEQNPTVTYDQAGVYDVTLTVSNAAGQDVATQSQLIVVDDVPSVGFTFSVTDSEVSFTSQVSNAATLLWDFGDGNTSSEANPVHTYAQDGAYTVTLTASNDCGEVSTSEIVVISTMAPPVAAFDAQQTTGCEPFTVTFQNLSSPNSETFQWSFPGGDPASSTEVNPTVTYAAPGTYDVTLIASNAVGSDTFAQTAFIEVLPLPTADFSHEVNGTTVSFTSEVSNATSLLWDFGDGTTSTEANPVHEYTQLGTFLVTLTASNDCGEVVVTQEVTVLIDLPVANFSGEPREGCVPLTVQFTDQSSGNPTEWSWEFPGGNPATSTEQNPVVTYEAPGVYDVILEVSNLAGSNTLVASQFIVTDEAPSAGFEAEVEMLQVTFTNTSTGADSFEWDFGDGNTSSVENPVHTYEQPGSYTVTLTASNDCGTSTFSMTIEIVVNAVVEIPGIEEFRVFPNPNSGTFTLVLRGQPLDALHISLFNSIGQRILWEEADFRTGALTRTITRPELAKGLYLLQLRSGNGVLHQKVVVE